MANERTQIELIESEMAQLIIELQQLKGVRESLENQSEQRTVQHYLIHGGVSGRIFLEGSSETGRAYSPIFSSLSREYYKIIDITSKYITGDTLVRVQEIDGKRREAETVLNNILLDKEAPIVNGSQ